jgi:HAD superfamily hydrolase (TIGR01509 family)
MDGVLVDSEAYWVPFEEEELFPQVLSGADVAPDEITGMNYRDIYDHLEAEYGTAVTREEFLALYDEAATEIFGERVEVLPVLREVLAALDEREIPVAMVTSSPPAWIEVAVERFDLDGAFDAIVSADVLDGPGKPAPDVYLAAADRLGVAPGECVAVEDSATGQTAAHRAGPETRGRSRGSRGTPHPEAGRTGRRSAQSVPRQPARGDRSRGRTRSRRSPCPGRPRGRCPTRTVRSPVRPSQRADRTRQFQAHPSSGGVAGGATCTRTFAGRK